MTKLFIKPEHLEQIKGIIKELYPKAIVWAYGSRINGSAHEGSDLDLAIKSFGTEKGSSFDLKEALVESNIPFLIDVLVFDELPKSFQAEIAKNYVEIYNGTDE
ncbi:MAG: nucleotidyltransferase family protein [Alphaproteobacteria bacterium]